MNGEPTTWADLDRANKADGHYKRDYSQLDQARYEADLAWRKVSETEPEDYPTVDAWHAALQEAARMAEAAEEWRSDLVKQFMAVNTGA